MIRFSMSSSPSALRKRRLPHRNLSTQRKPILNLPAIIPTPSLLLSAQLPNEITLSNVTTQLSRT